LAKYEVNLPFLGKLCSEIAIWLFHLTLFIRYSLNTIYILADYITKSSVFVVFLQNFSKVCCLLNTYLIFGFLGLVFTQKAGNIVWLAEYIAVM